MSFEPSSKRVLEPGDRVSEALLGLIVVLSSTGSPGLELAARAEDSGPGGATTFAPGEAKPDLPDAGAARAWAISISVMGYLVEGGDDYLQPTVTADRGALHLEGRYQYEAPETGSAWIGYNLAGGGKVSWEFTPMLGGVFGETMGVAPGFRGSLGWWRLELASEGECVIDAGARSDSFLYTWTELALAPVDGCRFGVAMQRTRAYASDRDVQWGPLVGVSVGWLDLTTYVFNLDDDHPLLVLALGGSY